MCSDCEPPFEGIAKGEGPSTDSVGAFAYLYGADGQPHEDDCYFCVQKWSA